MANVGGPWELVVKSSKKKNNSVLNGKLSKTEKKQFTENAPKINKFNMVAQNGEGKENKQPKPSVPIKPKENKKKKQEKKKDDLPKPPHTLEDAMKKITVDEVKNLMEVVTSKFKDSPLIWMKDLVSYLNVKLNPTQPKDCAFRTDPIDYPVILFEPQVKLIFQKMLKDCNDTTLALFHQHCTVSMVNEIPKGLSVYGYKLFLQLLAQYKPQVCVTYLSEYCDLRHSYQSQPATTLSLLWSIGQAGKKDFSIALKIWSELMLPLIGLKNYSAFVLDYGTNMFNQAVPDKDFSQILNVRVFFSLFDFTWNGSSSLQKPLQKQLMQLYPKIKNVAIGKSQEKCIHLFFPSFLRRLTTGDSEPLIQEILSSLTVGLSADPECWNAWKQLYLKHLPQSAHLLKHLNAQWISSGICPIKCKKEMQDKINHFVEVNQTMEHKIHAVAGLKEAIKEAKEFSNLVTHSQKTSWFSWKMFLFVVFVFAIVWDVRRNKSIKESSLGKVCERLGLAGHLETASKSIQICINDAYKWSIENVPIYYSRVCDLSGPYLQLLVEKTSVIFMLLFKILTQLSDNVVTFVSTAFEKFDSTYPNASSNVMDFLNKSGVLLVNYWNILCKSITPVADQFQNYFTK